MGDAYLNGVRDFCTANGSCKGLDCLVSAEFAERPAGRRRVDHSDDRDDHAKLAHLRQSRPDSGPGFQVKVLETP